MNFTLICKLSDIIQFEGNLENAYKLLEENSFTNNESSLIISALTIIINH